MPHALHEHRDEINDLIGPLEEVEAKLNDIIANIIAGGTNVADLYHCGVTSAKDALADLVHSIDEYEEPEVEAEAEAEEADEDEEQPEDWDSGFEENDDEL